MGFGVRDQGLLVLHPKLPCAPRIHTSSEKVRLSFYLVTTFNVASIKPLPCLSLHRLKIHR